MGTHHSEIISEATAFRAYEFATARWYEVHFEGTVCAHISASDLPQARGIVRRALRAAYASTWNQSLIFRGELEPGQVSRTEFRAHLRTEAEHHGKEFSE